MFSNDMRHWSQWDVWFNCESGFDASRAERHSFSTQKQIRSVNDKREENVFD